MRTPLMTRAGRLLGLVAVAGALALLLGGLAPGSARAETRDQAVRAMWDFISWCVDVGGTVNVDAYDEDHIEVSCTLHGGSVMQCQYWPTTNCAWNPLTRPPHYATYELGGDGGVLSYPPGVKQALSDAPAPPSHKHHKHHKHQKGSGGKK